MPVANSADGEVRSVIQFLNVKDIHPVEIHHQHVEVPYILESNLHPFYSFRGLKNQLRIRIECGLDSRSRAGFWKNYRAGVRAVRTVQLFIILFIILYNILKYL
jgi:hypothetical protein